MSARGMTMMMTLDRVKRCQKCCEIMDVSAFSADRTRGDGLQPKCKGCHAAYYEANRETIKAQVKVRSAAYNPAYYAANAETIKAKQRARFAENPKAYAAATRKWVAANPDKVRRQRLIYTNRNRGRLYAHAAMRRATRINATPAWADADAIRKFYEDAVRLTVETGIKYHVDHIIPLNSELVCGLHVQTNLRVILAVENLSKNNRLIEDLL